jgi:hypothetical protein
MLSISFLAVSWHLQQLSLPSLLLQGVLLRALSDFPVFLPSICPKFPSQGSSEEQVCEVSVGLKMESWHADYLQFSLS